MFSIFVIFAKVMRVLLLVPYPAGEAPSQRYRFEQYLQILLQHGILTNLQSFLSKSSWRIFYGSGNSLKKSGIILIGFLKRLRILFSLSNYDIVFIHREVTPVGPPVFEWLIAKIFRKKIIYDFDDAIWLTDKTNESRLVKSIRCRSKVASICKWSYRVSCGNDYLAAYTQQFNSNIIINPTTIDTNNVHVPISNKEILHSYQNDNKVVIGWTGSHSTLKYLTTIQPVLQTIEDEFPQVSFLVIADQKPDLKLQRLNFIQWKKETEADDLSLMDIGIMPLPDDEWTKGKCGFKALQYMAMEIPCVASPVGINKKIIDHGINGFLAATAEEWKLYLEKLITDTTLRITLGIAGREKIDEKYSVKSNAENFVKLFS